MELQRQVKNKIERVFLHCLKRFGTAKNVLETMRVKGAFETIWNYRDNFENKDAKWCILTAFDTIWNDREKNENKDDKWCILTAFETVEKK